MPKDAWRRRPSLIPEQPRLAGRAAHPDHRSTCATFSATRRSKWKNSTALNSAIWLIWRDRRMSLTCGSTGNTSPTASFRCPSCPVGIFAPGAPASPATSTTWPSTPRTSKSHGAEYQWRWQPFEATRLLLNQALIRIDASLLGVATSADSILRERIRKHAEASAPRHATTSC